MKGLSVMKRTASTSSSILRRELGHRPFDRETLRLLPHVRATTFPPIV